MSPKFSHVIVVGIDGAGAFIKDADTPYFDRIFAEGAVTYRALASNPSISAECWGSMLTGTGPEVHGLTNKIVGKVPYPTDSPFPSVFRRIRKVMPDAVLGCFCNWSPIYRGMVENDLNVTTGNGNDIELTLKVCDYIAENKPAFLFVQLDHVDSWGHYAGYGTPAHLLSIHDADIRIREIFDAVVDAGMYEDTLFIVIADHGGDGLSHGGWSHDERYVTFAAAGKGVQHTGIETMNVRDLAAIILYAFDIEAPELDEKGWTSQIPEGLFNDPSIPEYRDLSHLTGAAPRISKTPHTSELI
ncbi:MAG: alkaline phosphatase family protein [Clostridia bacterium]|nr:alkaline phosphatase family protein [Clostridia bacterium]